MFFAFNKTSFSWRRITLWLLRSVPTGIAVLWTIGIFTQRFLLVLHLCLLLPKAWVRLQGQCRKHLFLFLASVAVCLGEGADCFLISGNFCLLNFFKVNTGFRFPEFVSIKTHIYTAVLFNSKTIPLAQCMEIIKWSKKKHFLFSCFSLQFEDFHVP